MQTADRVWRRWIARFSLLGLSLIAGAAVLQGEEELKPTPPLATAEMPRPPQQDQPWAVPKTGLPRFLPRAATILFEQGLADPRGCEYRAVELAGESDVRQNQNPANPRSVTHAWVLPTDKPDGPRFAVAWNGLVYPLTALGAPADLEADVRALVQKADEARAEIGKLPAASQRNLIGWDDMRFPGAGDLTFDSQQGLAPMKVVLLLRLGRTDLAEAVWEAGTGRKVEPEVGRDLTNYGISYLTLASDWAWALLSRGASAHEHGNDPLALASLREVARIQPLIEAKAQEMGFARPNQNQYDGRSQPQPAPYLGFAKPLPALLADQERRTKEPKRTPALVTKFPDQATRIAALIRDFDQINDSSNGMGFNNLGTSDIVRAVVNEGDAAVEPLLECFEKDNRLTRANNRDTVLRSRGRGGRFLDIVSVAATAYQALTQILGTNQFGGQSRYYSDLTSDPAQRAAMAAEIRSYWEKRARGQSREEQFFRILADDSASPGQWLEAAGKLIHLYDPRYRGDLPPAPEGAEAKLRARANPSLTELMVRRVSELDRNVRTSSGGEGMLQVGQANEMALTLAAWDLPAAVPVLKARVARCAAIIQSLGSRSGSYHNLEITIGKMTMLRLKVGDASALDDYAAWIRTATPPGSSTGFLNMEMFEPMWRNPDHPAIVAAAKALFDDPDSPWVTLCQPKESLAPYFPLDLIPSPLLGMDAFRKLVLAGLADDREEGKVQFEDNGRLAVIQRLTTSYPNVPADDPLRPKPGTTMPIRVRDLFAAKLAGLGGTPPFEMYWPQAKRDEVIAADIAFLRQYGERFKSNEVTRKIIEREPFYGIHPPAILSFDVLDHPATPEDVKTGRAIFSLAGEGQGEVRTVALPERPMKAKWITFEDYPQSVQTYDPKTGKSATIKQYDQDGYVWQAEERHEGEGWKRFYGFVGRYVMARVPAEDIEFPPSGNLGWRLLTSHLDGRVMPPGGRVNENNYLITGTVAPGQPLPLTVELRNHRGIESTAPTDLARTTDGLALRDGITIRLFRVSDATGYERFDLNRPPARQKPPEPEAIAPRIEPTHYHADATKPLGPAESVEVMKLNLADLFDVSRPGSYRVEITFEDLKNKDGQPGKLDGQFFVKSGETPAP